MVAVNQFLLSRSFPSPAPLKGVNPHTPWTRDLISLLPPLGPCTEQAHHTHVEWAALLGEQKEAGG